MRDFNVQGPRLNDAPDGSEDILAKRNSLWLLAGALDCGDVGIAIWVCVVIDDASSLYRPRKTLRYTSENLQVEYHA